MSTPNCGGVVSRPEALQHTSPAPNPAPPKRKRSITALPARCAATTRREPAQPDIRRRGAPRRPPPATSTSA